MPVVAETGSRSTTPTHDPSANVLSVSPRVLLTARSPTPTMCVVIVVFVAPDVLGLQNDARPS